MAITHATVKAPGQQLFALADWNASHVIGANTIGNNEISSHLSTKITGFNTGSPIVFYNGVKISSSSIAPNLFVTSAYPYSFNIQPASGNKVSFLFLWPSGTMQASDLYFMNTSDTTLTNYGCVCFDLNIYSFSIIKNSAGTGTAITSFIFNLGFPVTFNNMISLTNVAMAAAPADHMCLGSTDLSAGNTQLSWYGEGTSVGNGTPAANRTIAVQVNGTQYYLLASTSSS